MSRGMSIDIVGGGLRFSIDRMQMLKRKKPCFGSPSIHGILTVAVDHCFHVVNGQSQQIHVATALFKSRG